MTSNTEKTKLAPLIHHPSDALDSFGCFDPDSRAWGKFDLQISKQIAEFERSHLHYLRHSANAERRSSFSEKSR